jgi:porin
MGTTSTRAEPLATPADTAGAATPVEPSGNPLEWDHLTGNWFGARDALAVAGIDIQASVIMDVSRNFQGGLRTDGSTFRHLFDLNVTLDLETLIGLQGGTVFADFYNHNGPDSSAVDTGDFQAYSNIDADGRTELAELWYRQDLFDGRVGIKVGKVEANADFAYVEHGGEFIHSSPGFSPTILAFPSYPDPATAVIVFTHLCDWLYANVGLFDGALQEGYLTGTRGPGTFLGKPADLFAIGEAGLLWELAGGKPGRLGVGGWGHTGTFDRFDGGTDHGTAGWYVVLDQVLTREQPEVENDEQGLAMFAQLAGSDDDVAEADWHVGCGCRYVGLLPTRDDDITGVMASYVHFSDPARAAGVFDEDYELAIEAFHRVQVTPWIALKPDLQYIVNPGGDADVNDAVVGTLRIEVVF